MPLIIRNRHDRAAVQLAHAGALRSTSEAIDQLQEQLRAAQQQIGAERSQHALNEAQLRQENAIPARELAETRLEIGQQDMRDAFAAAQSPSAMVSSIRPKVIHRFCLRVIYKLACNSKRIW